MAVWWKGEESRAEQSSGIICVCFWGLRKRAHLVKALCVWLYDQSTSGMDGLLCKNQLCMYIMMIQKQRKKKSGFWCLVLKKKTLEILLIALIFIFSLVSFFLCSLSLSSSNCTKTERGSDFSCHCHFWGQPMNCFRTFN